jgi:predicted transcriptional regulator
MALKTLMALKAPVANPMALKAAVALKAPMAPNGCMALNAARQFKAFERPFEGL